MKRESTSSRNAAVNSIRAFTVFLVFARIALHAEQFADFTYRKTSNGVAITDFPKDYSGPVVVPADIDGSPVTIISSLAFSACAEVTAITLPNSIKWIGDYAFSECIGLSRFDLPESVLEISQFAFSGCSRLNTFAVDTGNPQFSSPNGVLMDIDQSVIERYPPGRAGPYTIPGMIRRIGESSFESCEQLTEISIPASVEAIAARSFDGCTSLTNIVVDRGNPRYSSADGILMNADQTVLEIFPPGRIGEIVIPSGISTISRHAFSGSTQLTSITLPESVEEVGPLGEGGTCISCVFAACTQLESIEVDSNNSIFSSIDGALTNIDQTVLLRFPQGRQGVYFVPDSVSIVGVGAFSGCVNLTEITVPESVTRIEYFAFFGCAGLSSIRFEGNAFFARGLFEYTPDVTVLRLPGTTGWSDTFAERPTLLWLPEIITVGDSFGIHEGAFECEIEWARGKTVAVETSTSPFSTKWDQITVLTISENGTAHFKDPNSQESTSRFYRLSER